MKHTLALLGAGTKYTNGFAGDAIVPDLQSGAEYPAGHYRHSLSRTMLQSPTISLHRLMIICQLLVLVFVCKVGAQGVVYTDCYDPVKKEAHIQLQATAPAYVLIKENEWTRLECGGRNVSPFIKAGEPGLYAVTYLVSIPAGAQVSDVRLNADGKKIILDKPLKPVPEAVPVGDRPKAPVPDALIYGSAWAYPARDVDCSIQKQGHAVVLAVTCYPFQYIGVTRTLLARPVISIEVTLSSPEWIPSPTPCNTMDRDVLTTVVNPPDRIFFTAKAARPSCLAKPAKANSLATGDTADYVIITPGAWVTALNYYVTRKQAQGFKPRVFSLENIYAEYAGPEKWRKIKAFISDAYNAWGISYVLLAGGLDSIPSQNGIHELDNYYALLDGDTDLYQDVYIGRLPAGSYQETADISAAWADYNTYGWGRSELCLTGENVPASANNDFDDYNWQVKNLYGDYIFYTIQPETVIDAMNAGYGLVNYVGHGSNASWVMELVEYAGDQGFGYTCHHADSMTNGSRLSFVNAIVSCHTGEFTSPYSIARSFITADSGGAIGYIGSNQVVVNPGAPDYALTSFYGTIKDQYFRTGHARPGVAFHQAISGSAQLLYQYNLLGDPTADMDLLPAVPDATPPVITGIQISEDSLWPGESFTITALASDNDCVGLVTVRITKPDSTGIDQEMRLNTASGKYELYLYGSHISTVGSYRIRVTARDISQNQDSSAGPAFVVLEDTMPPLIAGVFIDPQPAYQNEKVTISATIIDSSAWGLVNWAYVLKPDSTIDSIGPLMNWWYDSTRQAGTYRLTVHARDYSGNVAAPLETSFTMNADSLPPVIHSFWVSRSWCMNESSAIKITSVDTPGVDVQLYLTVSDSETEVGRLTAWAKIIKPDSDSARINLMWCGGMWPAAYCGNSSVYIFPPGVWKSQLDLVGPYGIIFYAQDRAGHLAQSSPLAFVVNALPQAPDELTAVPVSCSAIQLCWRDRSVAEDSFGIERRKDGDSTYSLMAIVPANDTDYSDTGLAVNTRYWYQVFAYHLSDPFGYSNVAAASTQDIVPVELASFTAQANQDTVMLLWSTVSEQENLGWNILRDTLAVGSFLKVNAVLVPGAGTTGALHQYEYKDHPTAANTYYYKLEQINICGSVSYSGVVAVQVVLNRLANGKKMLPPEKAVTVYPNPFVTNVSVDFSSCACSAQPPGVIYDIFGNQVKQVKLDRQKLIWDGTDQVGQPVEDGIYFVRIILNDRAVCKRIFLTR
jgi:hypothetical protein